MLDAIELSSQGKMGIGAMGAAFGRNREVKAEEKAQAIQKGLSVQNGEGLETKVRGVAEDFVSVFMNQVMKSMRSTVPENPAMHGDNGEKFFQEMLDTEQSKTLAKGSGYGLTELVYQSLMSKANQQMRTAEQAAAQGSGADGSELVSGMGAAGQTSGISGAAPVSAEGK